MQDKPKVKPYSNLPQPSDKNQFNQSSGEAKNLNVQNPKIKHQKTEDVNSKKPYEDIQKYEKDPTIPQEPGYPNPKIYEPIPNKGNDAEKKPYSKDQKEIKYKPLNIEIQGKGIEIPKDIQINKAYTHQYEEEAKQKIKNQLNPGDNFQQNIQKTLIFNKGNFIKVNETDIKETYNLIKLVGKGSFGEVWDSKHKITQNRVAVKIISKTKVNQDEAMKSQMKAEFELLKKMDHPNVMRIFEAFENRTNIYIVSEFMDGGTLTKKTENKVLKESEISVMMSNILTGLAYCHGIGVAHRDLKPDNLMYETKGPNSCLKLIDFGLSILLDKKKTCREVLGSPLFMAPEVVKDLPYNEKCDIWSCGIMLYRFLSSQEPFNPKTIEQLYSMIKVANFKMDSLSGKYWNHVSTTAKKFLLRMLVNDPKSRSSASELLKDEFITKSSPDVPVSEEVGKSMLENFYEFSKESSLQRLVRNYIAASISTTDAITQIRSDFKLMDKNKDGKISKKEFTDYSTIMADNLGIETNELELIFQKMDTDKSGNIDYTEFLSASLSDAVISNRKSLESMFNFIDKNKSGFISPFEFKSIFKGEFGPARPAVEKMLRELDEDKNNKIGKEEFINSMQKMIYYQNTN